MITKLKHFEVDMRLGNLRSTIVFFLVQVSLVIHSRYIPSFWTANPEFEDKKSIFDQKIVIFDQPYNPKKRICRKRWKPPVLHNLETLTKWVGLNIKFIIFIFLFRFLSFISNLNSKYVKMQQQHAHRKLNCQRNR